MNSFIFDFPTKVYFGENSLDYIEGLIPSNIKNIMLITGSSSAIKSGLLDRVKNRLSSFNVFTFSGIKPNPSLKEVFNGIDKVRENNIDFIIAIGGGSVIDCAKAIALGAVEEKDTFYQKYFREYGNTVKEVLPLGVVLTIPASGSETSASAVISYEETKEKLIGTNDSIRPVFSIMDPRETLTINKRNTANGITDIFSHLLERYFDKENSILSDKLLLSAINHIVFVGEKLINDLDNLELRSEVMWAGTLAHSVVYDRGGSGGDWACHMIEHSLSAHFDIRHAEGLSVLIPSWVSYVSKKEPAKFLPLAKEVFNCDLTSLSCNITNFFKKLFMPTALSELEIFEKDIVALPEISPYYQLGNIYKLTEDEIKEILSMSL